MARMVLLLHRLADGTQHYDWLIEPVGAGPGSVSSRETGGGGRNDGLDPEERCLLAFRVLDRIDLPRVTAFPADELPLHRRHYLTFQGQIEGKGTVQRVAGGMVRKVEVMGAEKDGIMDAISIRGKFSNGLEYTWAGVREGDLWQFKRSKPNLVQGGKAGQRESLLEDRPSSMGEWEMRGPLGPLL